MGLSRMDGDRSRVTVLMTRDSVCMADDVDAPHEQPFEFDPATDLGGIARAVASTGYLPMPSDAWGWTIEAAGVVVAIRPGLLRRKTSILRGDPASVTAADLPTLEALYVRPGSRSHRPGR
jgi:hypothetical protein